MRCSYPLDRRRWERSPHRADGPCVEPRWVDAGVIGEHVARHLVEDRVRPARLERVKGREREQQIAEDDRIEDAGIQDVDRRHGQ